MGQTKHLTHRKWRKSKDFVSSAVLKTCLIIETSLSVKKFTSNDFFSLAFRVAEGRNSLLSYDEHCDGKSSTAQHFKSSLREQLEEERIHLMFCKTFRGNSSSRKRVARKNFIEIASERKIHKLCTKKAKRDKMWSKHEHKK